MSKTTIHEPPRTFQLNKRIGLPNTVTSTCPACGAEATLPDDYTMAYPHANGPVTLYFWHNGGDTVHEWQVKLVLEMRLRLATPDDVF